MLIIATIWLVMLVFHGGRIPDYTSWMIILPKAILITFVLQVCLYYNNLYIFNKASRKLDLVMGIVQAIGFSCLILAIVYYTFPFARIHKTIFFSSIVVLTVLLLSWRVIYQHVCRKQMFNEKLILVGDGLLSSLISKEIRDNLDSGYTISAVFSNPGNTGLADKLGVEKYNSYDQLCEIAQKKGINKIVVSLQERRGKYPTKSLLECRLQGITVLEGVSFYEMLSGKIPATQTPPSWLIFSSGFRRHHFVLLTKRGLDVLFASVGLVLSAPAIVALGLLVKATSSGPVFFWQARVGQHERIFHVIKFRTMREDAESNSGAVWALENDPRVTPVGRILRKFRLDEIPQFWNVLKGEMSFVGPRPERPEFVQQLKQKLPYYMERHTVSPGITGWAQVNYGYGASEDDALRKLEYDLFYIKNLSLLFDLYIALKTIKAVIVGNGVR